MPALLIELRSVSIADTVKQHLTKARAKLDSSAESCLNATGGWFARDADLLAQVGSIILDPGTRVQTTFCRVLLATDALDTAEPCVADAIHRVGGHLAILPFLQDDV